MKSYIKKKSGPNASGPKYRTPDHFSPRNRFGETGKKSKFSGKAKKTNTGFNPSQFKVQHKG